MTTVWAAGLSAVITVVSLSMTVVDIVEADEIAFVEVHADNQFEIRSLDVPVAPAIGTDNFFVSNPMASHDWSHVKTVGLSLQAQLLAASEAKSATRAGKQIRKLEEALRPLYQAMPKNDHGRLSNGTVYYCLHRFFQGRHGWSVKGLEPAGSSWLLTDSVTPDVKQISKYMVPSYIHELLLPHSEGKGVDLRLLSVFAGTLDHLIHAEMLEILYWVYTTLEFETAGRKTVSQVDDILSVFMMVYAFGSDLEVSTGRDMIKAREYLDAHHSGWIQMKELVQAALQKTTASVGQGTLDFEEIMLVTNEIAERYGRWQRRDCARAKDQLASMSGLQSGRVPLSTIDASHAPSYRSLFNESAEELRTFGVLDESDVEHQRLIVANYINSKAMCLSTASFYVVCCANEGDQILQKLELDIAAPAATPHRIHQIVSESRSLPESSLAELQEIAGQNEGSVLLHSRSFAQWLHNIFPLECPAPGTERASNPKTADEWMAAPGEGEYADVMMTEIADVLSRYTAMGKVDDVVMNQEESQDSETDTITLYDSTHPASLKFVQQSRRRFVTPCLMFFALTSVAGLVFTNLKSVIAASGSAPECCKQGKSWHDIA